MVPNLPPMLAVEADSPPSGPEWLHELKFDGYRTGLQVSGDQGPRLRLRRGGWIVLPEISKAAASLPAHTFLDGELVVLEGLNCDFDAIASRVQSGGRRGRPVSFVAFDLLWLRDADLTKLPLVDRKAELAALIAGTNHPSFAISETFEDGLALFQQVDRMGLEGIVSKWRQSIYRPGARSKRWVKVKTEAGKATQAARSESWYPAKETEP